MIIVDSFNHWGVSFVLNPKPIHARLFTVTLDPTIQPTIKPLSLFGRIKVQKERVLNFYFSDLQKNPYILMRINENNSAANIPCSHVRYIEVR